MSRVAAHIESLEPDFKRLSDVELRGKAEEFRARLGGGEALEDLLPEAFAVAREGAVRTIGLHPNNVQLMAGVALHTGNVAEMKGGEGKTLAASMAAYLDALDGEGVHVAVANDHLARRDGDAMGRIYSFLGLSVGVITSGMSASRRQQMYKADIAYGNYHELCYDYLRDNMTWLASDMVQRGRHYAIVDDIDHVLIDNGPSFATITGPGKNGENTEPEVLARITIESYFRSYAKLAGMTETAQAEAAELREVFGTRVIPIPRDRPAIREDLPDLIYSSEPAKFEAVAEDIAGRHERGQPVLVGITGPEKVERLSGLLAARGVTHEVVDGEHDERDAAVMAGAGRAGAVTVVVNMAARGVDIALGGACGATADQVREAGGLYVVGTERHPSRRFDDQLRGRSGRRGEPGASRFYLSFDDKLVRVNDAPRTGPLGQDEPAPPPVTWWVHRKQVASERAHRQMRARQRARNEPIDRLREEIYHERRAALYATGTSIASRARIDTMLAEVIEAYVDRPRTDLRELWEALGTLYPIGIRWQDLGQDAAGPSRAALLDSVLADARAAYQRRVTEIDHVIPAQGGMRELERQIALTILDRTWRKYLADLDQAQTPPGHQRRSHEVFHDMMHEVAENMIGYLFNVQVAPETDEKS